VLPRQPRQVPGELAGVQRGTAVLGKEQLAGDLGPDPGPDIEREGCVTTDAEGPVVGVEALRHLDPERRHVIGVDRERLAQGDGCFVGGLRRAGRLELECDVGGQRVVAGTEQGPHLFGGHPIAGVQTVQTGHAGADPPARGFALVGVVGRQRRAGVLGRVLTRDLPGQVLIPRPGRDLVQRHRHNNQKPQTAMF
jgi:hypothetical protein